MMQWLDRFCQYEPFGVKITKNGVAVKKIWDFKVAGVRLQINRG
jgi:hypothetical protein